MAARRLRPALKHLREVTVVEQHNNGAPDPEMDAMYGRELKGVLRGPFALVRARISGRKAEPLKESSNMMRIIDFRRDLNWGDDPIRILSGRLALASVVLGSLGALGALPFLPIPVLAVCVGVFVLAGPGCLALSFYPSIQPSVLYPLIPAVSIAVCILVVSGLLMLGFYDPVVVLLGLVVATIFGGLAHCGYLARRTVAGEA